jgi:hypothetical protein
VSRSPLTEQRFTFANVKAADGPYPCSPYCPSLAAWRSLAAASAAVVVFELPFVRSAAVFAVAVVFGFAAAAARLADRP